MLDDMSDDTQKLKAPSFSHGDNAIAGVPSRLDGDRLWIRGRSASGGCFVWAGIIFSLIPAWVGMSMRQQDNRWLWVGLGMSLAALITIILASFHRWEEFVIADREARTIQTVRLAVWGSIYGPAEPVPHDAGLVLARLLQAKREFYSDADVAPGDTLYTFWGPTQLNVRWHELLVVGGRGERILVLTDEPLPASHVDMFRIAGKGLSEFMGLPFSDYSRELTDFEKTLPKEHAPIEYVALPEEMRHFDTREPICAGYDLPSPAVPTKDGRASAD